MFESGAFRLGHSVIRGLQFLFALVILILTAIIAHLRHGITYNNFALFTSLFTILFLIFAMIVVERMTSPMLLYVVLGVEVIVTIFWIACFASFANHLHYFCPTGTAEKFECGRAKGIIGVSVVEFILFLITLALVGIFGRGANAGGPRTGGAGLVR